MHDSASLFSKIVHSNRTFISLFISPSIQIAELIKCLIMFTIFPVCHLCMSHVRSLWHMHRMSQDPRRPIFQHQGLKPTAGDASRLEDARRCVWCDAMVRMASQGFPGLVPLLATGPPGASRVNLVNLGDRNCFNGLESQNGLIATDRKIRIDSLQSLAY